MESLYIIKKYLGAVKKYMKIGGKFALQTLQLNIKPP